VQAESALVAIIPEAEPLVRDFRDRYDPSARLGVPAHVTVLYPFKAPAEIGTADIERLKMFFAEHASFSFVLKSIGSFGNRVLYLTVEPEGVFKDLTAAVQRHYPDTPPYRGQFTEVVPHLTVADHLPDAGTFHVVANQFASASRSALPICAKVSEVSLLDNKAGTWRMRSKFKLGTQTRKNA
jgi:2'-5' RNA ligase